MGGGIGGPPIKKWGKKKKKSVQGVGGEVTGGIGGPL